MEYFYGFLSGLMFGLVLAYGAIPAVVTIYRAAERRWVPARRHVP